MIKSFKELENIYGKIRKCHLDGSIHECSCDYSTPCGPDANCECCDCTKEFRDDVINLELIIERKASKELAFTLLQQ